MVIVIGHGQQQLQSYFFLVAHFYYFFFSMVVETDEMQHTMDDNAVQFALVAAAKGLSILFDAVDADAKLTRQYSLTIGQREGDDVGVEVMTKTLLVDF